ncbi:MAG: DEAD/DEAH box helicase [Clostridiales bacterium]|nr:DEAD/DEAH box helicase [Clostridiales bacterium]
MNMRNIGEVINAMAGDVGSAVQAVKSGKKTSVFGLTKSDVLLFCCAFDKFMLVCPDVVAARMAFTELSLHYRSVELLLPKNNVLLISGTERNGARARALYNIASGKCDVVVTTSEALMQIVPPPEYVCDAAVKFEVGIKMRTDEVLERLTAAGYTRCGHVDEPAQFSVRGDILDVCAPSGEAARIEFFGYECDSIRALDISSQSAGEKLDEFIAYAATETVFADRSSAIAKLIEAGERRKTAGVPVEHRMAERLRVGDRDGEQTVLPLFEHTTLDKFCNLPIIVADAKSVYDGCVFAHREHASRAKRLIEAGESPFCAEDNLVSTPPTCGCVLCFHAIDSNNRFFSPDAVYKFKSLDLPLYGRNLIELRNDIASWRSRGMRVLIGANIRAGLEQIDCFDVEYISPVADGGVFFAEDTVVIGMRNVGMKRDPFESVRRTGMAELPKPGDYVVHETHGIGLCEAVGAVDFGGYERDYITVKYAGGDTLYVPVENMGRLSKYDFNDNPPKLSKLGGGEFERVKARVKSRLKAMAFDLLELYAKRETVTGKAYGTDGEIEDAFAADFPYTETPDQLAAIDACFSDLTSGKIMDRLICGDVGFGKTEVALRVAFKVVAQGGQVAFMSPTTVLCHQHYNTTRSRMERFGVSVAALSRAEPNTAKTLKGLENGSIDIVCGTHKLLGGSVKFKNLELLILDEEQKFGVSDKEKIKNLKTDVNVLTLSATPIPRTLHMALSGIRDVSMLETPPTGRLPAQVYVTEYSDALCVDAVTREVARGGQVFIVYNYVTGGTRGGGIAEYTGRLQSLMPEIKFVYAHGQMEKQRLTSAVEDFAAKKADVLVATTIIENGIDIPNANTMIVYGAENMGLSQMYQLKGRVGRSDRVAQVYFTYGNETTLSGAALERLTAVSRYTELGSGVKIAEQDMRIRGVGNVFGAEQHGHMVSVGYEMYCKLLQEAVAEIKGQAVRTHKDPVMKVDFTAVIPKDYCDGAMRVELYRRISQLKTEGERDELLSRLKDAYETVPTELKNLANVGLIKNLAAAMNATTVTLLRSGAKIEFSDVKDVQGGFEKFGGVFNAVKTPIVIFDSVKSLMRYVVENAQGKQ